MRRPPRIRIDIVELWAAMFLGALGAVGAVIWIFQGDPLPLIRLAIFGAPLMFALHLVVGWCRRHPPTDGNRSR